MAQRREQSHLRASTSDGGAEEGRDAAQEAEKDEQQELEELYARPPPLLRDVSAAERENLVRAKLRMCRMSFDFGDATTQPREKELKRQTLLEMVDVVNGTYGKLGEGMYEEVVQTISANLFRALPPTGGEDGNGMDGDEDEPTLEPAWSHLQIVYEMLLRFVVSTDTDTKLSYCVTQFVEKDPTLAEPVIRALLKFWPLTNSQKEVIFIGELEEVLELTQLEEFSKDAYRFGRPVGPSPV
eukprot:jgi/Pico_ML_1/53012/g3634.t1